MNSPIDLLVFPRTYGAGVDYCRVKLYEITSKMQTITMKILVMVLTIDFLGPKVVTTMLLGFDAV